MNSTETSSKRKLLRFFLIAGVIGLAHFTLISIAIGQVYTLAGPLTWTEQITWAVVLLLGMPCVLLPNQWRDQFPDGAMLFANSLIWGVSGYLLFDCVRRWRDPNRRQSIWRFSLMSLVVVTTVTAIIFGVGLYAHNAAKRDDELRTEWEDRGVLVSIGEGRVVSIYPNSDRDLTQLAHCPDVSVLMVNEDGFAQTNVTDNGLRHLSHAPNLTSVVLFQSAITDSGIAYLSVLRKLKILSLTTCNITDAGLADLSPLESLRELDISYTGITDQSIPHLAKFQPLERLSVYGTGITEEGRKRLKQALPNCRIDD